MLLRYYKFLRLPLSEKPKERPLNPPIPIGIGVKESPLQMRVVSDQPGRVQGAVRLMLCGFTSVGSAGRLDPHGTHRGSGCVPCGESEEDIASTRSDARLRLADPKASRGESGSISPVVSSMQSHLKK